MSNYSDYRPDTKFHKFVYYTAIVIGTLAVALIASLNVDDDAPMFVIFVSYGSLLIALFASISIISYLEDPYEFKARWWARFYTIREYINNEIYCRKANSRDKFARYWKNFKFRYRFFTRLDMMYDTGLNEYDKSHEM